MAEFVPHRSAGSWIDPRGRHRQRAKTLREGQTFVILTQERFSFSILALTIDSLTRRAGFVTVKTRPNNYGIIEITFDEDAMIIVLPVKEG